jgi:hypothetical protein
VRLAWHLVCLSFDMDETLILKHLALAERHVLESERRVTQQQALVERLERDGHDTMTARELLLEFERSLELHRYDLARIRAELTHAPESIPDLPPENSPASLSGLQSSPRRDRL